MSFKAVLATLTSLALSSTQVLAGKNTLFEDSPGGGVPEVSSNGALAAIVAVAAIGALIWERRRVSSNIADSK